MTARRLPFLLLIPILFLGILLPARASELPFTDVPADAWFAGDVETAWSLGLINGKTETAFLPNDNMSCAEAVKLAACMHQKYIQGEVTLENGEPWYSTYVEYAEENGIITQAYDWDSMVTRAVYMDIFSRALPDDALAAVNRVPDDSIPDVPVSHPQAAGVYKLYRAGIVQGVDDAYNCAPNANIKRSEVAAVLHRMMDPQSRKSFSTPAVITPGIVAAAKAIVEQYQDAAIPADRRVNLIGIQMEAFVDLSRYNIQNLSPETYRAFHTLEQMSYTGNLITDIFANSTTETEWAVLTGGNMHDDFKVKTNSVAWYLKGQGYTANGSHPCLETFYDRKNVNPNLGLDDYLFTENYYYQFITKGARVAYDSVFFPDLQKRLGSYFASSQKPLFSFNVTYQGHGPYETQKVYWNANFCTGPYSQACRNALNNYLWCVHDSGNYMLSFVNYLNTLKQPVVLFLYSDHKPWMGNSNEYYRELGINLDLNTEEGFRNYYSTWYLFWANDAAKAMLGQNFVGKGPDLSPCFLMDHLFQMLGWQGSDYMQAQREIANTLPVLHTKGWVKENGVLTPNPSNAAMDLMDKFQQLSYFDRHRFAGQ